MEKIIRTYENLIKYQGKHIRGEPSHNQKKTRNTVIDFKVYKLQTQCKQVKGQCKQVEDQIKHVIEDKMKLKVETTHTHDSIR